MTSQPSLLIEELAFAYPDGNQALFGVNLTIQNQRRIFVLKINRNLIRPNKVLQVVNHDVQGILAIIT